MTENHIYHRPDLEAEDAAYTGGLLKRDLDRILDEDSIIFDVGANRGQFAKELLDIKSVRRIYSFEPVKEAYSELEVIASENPVVVPVYKAVAIENGSSSFFVTESDVGSSLLKPLPGQPSKWLTFKTEVMVETQRLDCFMDSLPADERLIGLLKSDVQGCDLDVLKSAGVYLQPSVIKSILVEINFVNFYAGQQNYHEIFSLLDASGYRMAWIYPHRAHDEWLWWADVLFVGK